MTTTIRKTVSLPRELARTAERMARSEGRTLSAVVQDALREAQARRFRDELGALQDYWSRRAKERGILTEDDLEKLLKT